jgi:membrane-associated protease RseP (regulator of RpoE activity)
VPGQPNNLPIRQFLAGGVSQFSSLSALTYPISSEKSPSLTGTPVVTHNLSARPADGACLPTALVLQRTLCSMLLILSVIVFSALAMLVHELGHLVAARVCHVPASELGLGMGRKIATFRIAGIKLSFGVLPTGSFVMLDGTVLKERSVRAQLLVHLGGIIFNLIAGLATYGTTFSWLNLLLAVGNILPLYQHDGWKCGVVVLRALMQRSSPQVERAFTFSGGFVSLVIAWYIARLFM